MNGYRYLTLVIVMICLSSCSSRYRTSRSSFRKQDPKTPVLTTRWTGDSQRYSRSSSHYDQYPLFDIFDESYFRNHTLPPFVTYQEGAYSVGKDTLNTLIEHLIQEIDLKKKRFSDFIVLQNKNFNHKKKCGLIVLRFKNYPFVLKLFMETPETFIDPYCKGIEPTAFFFMSGGSNRHISGLTRMYNLEYIQEQLSALPQWSIHLPRKWFWAPQNNRYIEIEGINIKQNQKLTTFIPSTYAIIADAIEIKENHTLSTKHRNDLIMSLCADLHYCIDPHHDNYIITRDKDNEHTIHILDTEHFPSMVGIRDNVSFKSHTGWYLYLAEKCAWDAFFRLKHERTHVSEHASAFQVPKPTFITL